jgi:two-component system sensor histidine kinase SenX3
VFRKHFSKRMWLLLALLALLPVMAFEQYRWINQVSDAAHQRAKARLESSVEQLVTEFDAEITRAHMAFWAMPREPVEASARFAERYQEWNRLAPYPQLIRDIYLIETSEEPWRLSRIDSSGAVVAVAEWPADLAGLKPRLEEPIRPGPPGGFRRLSGLDDITINGNPAFVVPLRSGQARTPAEPRRRRWDPLASRPTGWAVISLDGEYIRREFLPDLTKRLFRQGGESDYALLVVRADAPDKIVFQTDPAAARGLFATPDSSASLFATRPDCFTPARPPSGGPGPRSFMPGGFPDRTKEILTRKPSPCGSVARTLGRADGKWKLLVKRHGGSLDTAFATFRLRTMTISFGVLLVLASGITMLTISTERARVLAKLQMEFAMGVSHELRTPLTVIRVAADNLANGMMENAQHAQRYGRMIGDEARRLTDMVEQILTFARAHSPARSSDLAPVSPEHIVRRALTACGPALREAGMEVERFVGPDLPQVRVDENLVVDCLQNLINNAVKYAASGGWVGVRAEAIPHPVAVCVRISVEDHGPGIEPDDLPHIFDPFYRSQAIRNSQIPGVGLGLSLVKRIVEAHRGMIEVKSSPQSGTIFFLYLPAEAAPVPAETEMKEVAS